MDNATGLSVFLKKISIKDFPQILLEKESIRQEDGFIH